jgi:hypothetical protein
VQKCEVCGRKFDPLGFQVVVPELARSFDRIECARSARALGGARALAVTPLVAVADPTGSAATPATLSRALGPLASAPVAALTLFAAGTAAAAYLWVGVLSADSTRFSPSHAAVARASGIATVQAQPQPQRVPAATSPTPVAVTRPVSATPLTRAPAASSTSPTALRPGLAARWSSARDLLTRSEASMRAVSKRHEKHGKGHAKHGKGHAKHGKGHAKHGETNGVHSPGHSYKAGGGHGPTRGHKAHH